MSKFFKVRKQMQNYNNYRKCNRSQHCHLVLEVRDNTVIIQWFFSSIFMKGTGLCSHWFCLFFKICGLQLCFKETILQQDNFTCIRSYSQYTQPEKSRESEQADPMQINNPAGPVSLWIISRHLARQKQSQDFSEVPSVHIFCQNSNKILAF